MGAPNWLREYCPTGLRIVTDDPLMHKAGAGFAVFVRPSIEKDIVLGPAAVRPHSNSSYFAFFGTEKHLVNRSIR